VIAVSSCPQSEHCKFGHGVRAALSRLLYGVLLAVATVGATCGVALGVVGGKTVSITAAPWTVVIREYDQQECTGVIIDPSHILTAGHCVMSGNSAKLMSASVFTIEAGVSDFRHPLKSDHLQFRDVSVVRAMPGYIATSKLTSGNDLDAIGHDLAVLTLSRPLDLDGDDARAAYLPTTNTPMPSRSARLVMAGFGNDNPNVRVYPNGTLNEVTKSKVKRSCSTSHVLCIFMTTATCWGDSGSGAIEPRPRPTVVGIFSASPKICAPATESYVALTAPAALRFIKMAT
jgi:secreted trypsin-like serine protease